MSEKRFQKGENLSCVDTETGKSYWYACNLCGLLNEQQSEINSLKMELELISGEKLFSRREVERKVDEQQSTINELKEENKALKKFIKDNFNEMMDSKMVMRNE